MCRLAAKDVPQGGSFAGTQKRAKNACAAGRL